MLEDVLQRLQRHKQASSDPPRAPSPAPAPRAAPPPAATKLGPARRAPPPGLPQLQRTCSSRCHSCRRSASSSSRDPQQAELAGTTILGAFSLHDLVMLDRTSVGCIVKVEHSSFKLLSTSGELLTVELPQMEPSSSPSP